MILFVSSMVLTSLIHTSMSSTFVQVIKRDVCIIGGGSSGTFSAIQLQKAGKSVVVIEKEKVLGGHSNTYIDPKTYQAVDYGVALFENLEVVKNYFDYLKVRWDYGFPPSPPTKYFDFSNSKIENNATVPDPRHALQTYLTQLIRYPEIQNGFFLPNPVPDDLLLPFGEFVTKYKIGDAVQIMWKYSQGIGDLLRQPTLYVVKLFGLNIIQKDLVDGFILPENRNSSKIYSKAYEMLKNNVLLDSYPIRIVRDKSSFVKVSVKTPVGCTLITAKKLLVTIPPVTTNLHVFDLNSYETKIFNQFENTAYYTGLVRSTGLPANVSVDNINTNNPYGIPTLPALYSIMPTIMDGLFDVKYCSPHFMTVEAVKTDILASISKLQKVGTEKKTWKKPEFVEFSIHAPFHLTVSAEAVKNGFYDQLYSLQGKRNTYWTGSTFHVHNSGFLWKFTDEIVIPLLIESL